MENILQSNTLSTNSIWKELFKFFGWSMVFVPITIMLHEVGHYLVGFIFQFPNLKLHYGSVSHNAAEVGFPNWQLALQAAAGPIITITIASLCCYLVGKKKPEIYLICAGMVAPVRFLIGAVYLFWLITILILGGTMGSSNFDEYNVASLTNIPLALILGFETVFMFWTWWFLGKKINKKGGVMFITSIIIGTALGIFLWLNLFGPIMLP